MEILFLILSVVILLLTLNITFKIIKLKNIKYQKPEFLSDKKILTLYYSNGGNTENVAKNLHSIIGGDIREIQFVEKYPKNVFKMSKLVRQQKKQGYLLKTDDIDISDYDIIFVGSPVWGFSLSIPLKSFLKNNSFENKILVPFFTCSGGVIKSKLMEELKTSADTKDTKTPLFMLENGIFLIKEQIIDWLNKL